MDERSSSGSDGPLTPKQLGALWARTVPSADLEAAEANVRIARIAMRLLEARLVETRPAGAPRPLRSPRAILSSEEGDWPAWAPAAGAWVRHVAVGERPGDLVSVSGIWHVSAGSLVEWESWYTLAPLCGRDIRIDARAVPVPEFSGLHGARLGTFEVAERPERRCGHCVRYAARRGLTTQ